MKSLPISAKIAALTAWTALAPIHGAIGAALFLTMADMFTGMYAAKKRGEKISQSRGWRRTLVKLAIYETAIVCGFACETYLTGPMVPALKLACTLVGTVELKSILENLDSISGDNFFRSVIDRLAGPREQKIEPKVKEEEKED